MKFQYCDELETNVFGNGKHESDEFMKNRKSGFHFVNQLPTSEYSKARESAVL